MGEAWESGRSVSKSSAGEAAVAQRAPVEHQAGTGWPAFHGAAYVHLKLKKCCGFLELQIDHVIGFGKALLVVRCAIASSIELRRSFARWTERALGNRGKPRISLKTSQKTRFTPPRSGPCLAWSERRAPGAGHRGPLERIYDKAVNRFGFGLTGSNQLVPQS